MATDTKTVKRGSLGKKLGIIFGIILLLVVVLYFVVTSTAFFKGVILPRVSNAVGAEVTVADASIRPFSSVSLQKVKVQPPNAEPILEAEQLVARYSLMDIVRGNINVHELTLISPVIRIVEEADGKSNLDPVTQPDAPAKEPTKDEAPPQLNIRNVTVKNGTLRMIKRTKEGGEELTELSNLNVQLDQLRNAAPGNLDLAADVRMQSTMPDAAPSMLTGSLNGKFNFALDQNLSLQNAKGNGQFVAKNASGDYSDLVGLTALLNADLSPTQVQDLSIEFSRGGRLLGHVRANGPFNMSKQEGKLNVVMDSIDRNVLNVFGAGQGIDFNKTQINSTNSVELSKGGEFVSVQGQLRVNSFSVTQTNQTTPVVDLTAQYNVIIDQPNETALIKTFTLNGTQNKQPLLRGTLSRPMQLNWGATNGAVEESAFDLTVTNLNLADWRAFAGDLNPSGTAGLRLNAVARGGGNQIQFDLNSRLQNFSAQFDTNRIDNADITMLARGQLADLKNLNLTESRVELAQGGQRAATATASGTYSTETGDADLKATLDASLPSLFQLVQIADSKATAGRATFNGQVKQAKDQQTVIGNFAIENFTGNYGEYVFQNYNVASEADLQSTPTQVQIRRMVTTLRQGNQNGGTIQVSGNMNPETSIGSFDLQMNGLNENGLRPFLTPTLGERKLNSILVNGNGTAKLNSTNNYALTANLNVGNLVILEPGQTTAPSPLAAKLNVDVAMQDDTLQLRHVDANVDYAGQPAGQFNVTGNYNTATERGNFDLKLAGLNQNAVRTVMPKVGDKDLVTISINGNASAQLNSTNDAVYKADLRITDLVVRDPKKPQPEAPLSAQLQLDSTMANQVMDLRQLQLNLSPTARAKNQLLVTGKLDLSNTNAANGDVTITSDSLDVTQFYNLYTGTDEQPQAAPGAAAPAPAAPAPDANQEPEPMNLPVGRIMLKANIGQLYLRELAITNLQTQGRLLGNRLTANPQMTMNGAPVKANLDIDMGVRGYTYNIAFTADRLPLQPIANTFLPEYRDQLQGLIIGNADIRGAGITGTSLRQSLNGSAAFTFTNANIQISSPKYRPILVVAANVLRAPEISETPINWADVNLAFGNGDIGVQRLIVESEAVRLGVQGKIPIADELMDSPIPNLPVNFELRQSIARKISRYYNIIPEGTPEDQKYVTLPPFYRIGGTLGDPDPQPDAAALAKGAATRYIQKELEKRAPEVLGEDAGSILKGLRGIIGGGQQGQTNAPQQAPPGTNAPPAQPGTTTNAPVTPRGLLDLIRP